MQTQSSFLVKVQETLVIHLFQDQGIGAFWRGKLTNSSCFVPTLAINVPSKGFFKTLPP
jgi:hypothetical protein